MFARQFGEGLIIERMLTVRCHPWYLDAVDGHFTQFKLAHLLGATIVILYHHIYSSSKNIFLFTHLYLRQLFLFFFAKSTQNVSSLCLLEIS